MLNFLIINKSERLGEKAMNVFLRFNPLTRLSTTLFLLTATSLALPLAAFAQVVSINVGVEELYDDNIFLEDDRPVPTELLANLPQETIDQIITKDNDGDPNDSFITHPFVSLEAALPKTSNLSRYSEIKSKVTFGAYIFSSDSDENRLSLDSLISAKTTDTLLPNPWVGSVSSQFLSGSKDISVAQGSAGEQVQTHDATLGFGVESWEIAPKTEMTTGYELVRHDFLGDFVLNSGDDDSTRDANGADYLSNGLNGGIVRHVTEKLDLELNTSVRYMDFSKIESNDPLDPPGDEQDRMELDAGGGATYVVNPALQVHGSAGVNFTNFSDQPQDRLALIDQGDGTLVEQTVPADDSLTSLFYNGRVDYTPDSGTSLNLDLSQSQETDIDGTRIIVRSVSLNGTQNLGESLKVIGSARYLQFEEGDSLSDATDRWELLAQLRYQLFEAASLTAGYSYITQNADIDDPSVNFSNGDYDVNRVFIRLDFGLAGITT